MTQKTPMRWIGTTKLTSATSVVSFGNVANTASGFNISLTAADSTAMDVNQGGTWRMGFRIYFRALINGSSNSMYYGSYPLVKDAQNSGSSWDRQGMYWSNGTVPTNTSAAGWTASATHYVSGAMFTMCDEGATGAGNWRYGFQSNSHTSSLASSDSAFEHGYINYMLTVIPTLLHTLFLVQFVLPTTRQLNKLLSLFLTTTAQVERQVVGVLLAHIRLMFIQEPTFFLGQRLSVTPGIPKILMSKGNKHV